MVRKKTGVNTSKERPRKSSCTKYDYSILLEKLINIWTSHIFIKYLCEKKIKNYWPTFFEFLFRSLLYTLYVFCFFFFFTCLFLLLLYYIFYMHFLKSRMYFLVRKNSWYDVICVLSYSDFDRKWYRDSDYWETFCWERKMWKGKRVSIGRYYWTCKLFFH